MCLHGLLAGQAVQLLFAVCQSSWYNPFTFYVFGDCHPVLLAVIALNECEMIKQRLDRSDTFRKVSVPNTVVCEAIFFN